MEQFKTLRQFIKEEVSASPKYMKLERVRKKLQDKILQNVVSGNITNQSDLEKFLTSIIDPKFELAVTTLRSVPFSVWSTLASPKM